MSVQPNWVLNYTSFYDIKKFLIYLIITVTENIYIYAKCVYYILYIGSYVEKRRRQLVIIT
jgi:hypothetical protein